MIICSLLAPFRRSALGGGVAGDQHTSQSYQPLDLVTHPNIISCTAYITSPQGTDHAFTCTNLLLTLGKCMMLLDGVNNKKMGVDVLRRENQG
jgi:hypothetical protein